MLEVGRDLWRSSSPTPLLKRVHLQPVTQDCVQMGFEHVQGRRLHHLCGHPVPVLSNLHSEKMSADVQTEPYLFQFVPTAHGSVTGHNWKQPGSVFFISYLQIFVYVDKIPPETSLRQVKQSQLLVFLLGEMMQSLKHFSGLSLDSPLCPCLPCAREPRTSECPQGLQ